MAERPLNVLFLCTHNSARSVLAEVLLNQIGRGRFKAYSAGSHPSGRVNSFALELLERNRLPTAGLLSKGWDEFARADAPPLDFVFTVCDQAAGEVCPIWPAPMTAHWGIEDPATVRQRRGRKAFRAYTSSQPTIFVSLPLRQARRLGSRCADEIGGLRGNK
jgi:arsenate reductase